MFCKALYFLACLMLVVAAETNTTSKDDHEHEDTDHERETNGYVEVDEDVTNEACTAGLPEDECTARSQGKGPKEKVLIPMIKTYARIGFQISEVRPADMTKSFEVCCHGTVFYLVKPAKTPKPHEKKPKKKKFTAAQRARLRKGILKIREKRKKEREEKMKNKRPINQGM